MVDIHIVVLMWIKPTVNLSQSYIYSIVIAIPDDGVACSRLKNNHSLVYIADVSMMFVKLYCL